MSETNDYIVRFNHINVENDKEFRDWLNSSPYSFSANKLASSFGQVSGPEPEAAQAQAA